jgi:hypothetical protein
MLSPPANKRIFDFGEIVEVVQGRIFKVQCRTSTSRKPNYMSDFGLWTFDFGLPVRS